MSPVHRSRRGGGATIATPTPDPDPDPEDPEPGTVLVADDFNRANGALGTSSSGHVWTHTGWTVAANQGKPPSSGGYQLATVDAGEADVTITAVFDPNEAPDWGLCARVIDVNNFVFFDIVWEIDHWLARVHQRVAGSFGSPGPLTALINPIVGLANNTTPFTAAMSVTGSAGEVWINDVSIATWAGGLDSSLVAPTLHGLVGNDVTSGTFDDFEITLN